MTRETTLPAARQRVAERHNRLLSPAILRGDWDAGSLVQAAIREIEGEKPGAT